MVCNLCDDRAGRDQDEAGGAAVLELEAPPRTYPRTRCAPTPASAPRALRSRAAPLADTAPRTTSASPLLPLAPFLPPSCTLPAPFPLQVPPGTQPRTVDVQIGGAPSVKSQPAAA